MGIEMEEELIPPTDFGAFMEGEVVLLSFDDYECQLFDRKAEEDEYMRLCCCSWAHYS